VYIRAIIDQKQHSRRRDALYQEIQKGLRLAVDPVQILEKHQQRLRLALA
jgi:hypothetical protein